MGKGREGGREAPRGTVKDGLGTEQLRAAVPTFLDSAPAAPPGNRRQVVLERLGEVSQESRPISRAFAMASVRLLALSLRLMLRR